MKLWIRSQDKEKLLKCNDIAILKNMINEEESIKFKGYKIVGYFDKNTEYEKLGTYETKERALEVLDEIEKLIKPITIFQNYQVDKSTIEKIKETGYCMVNNDARVEQISQVFYQMPEK